MVTAAAAIVCYVQLYLKQNVEFKKGVARD